jgi:putative DNA primase/helicase
MYVFVCEGEKDVDRLIGLGLKATCNPGGAARRGTDGKPAKSKWPPDFGAQFFRDRRVVILPDNDDAGRDHAQAIVKNLAPVSHKIKFIELPGLPPKGDVSDWLNAGGTREELEDLVLAAPDITVEEPDAVQAEAISIVDGAPEFSDEHLALEFARRHEGGLRYTAIWGRWYLWSGVYWRADQTLAAFDLARVLCRDASSRITDPRGIKLARMIASSRTVASITTLARSDRVIATEHVAWDYDEWTLNSS